MRTFVAFKISHFILHFEAVSRISHCDASRKGIALAPHFGPSSLPLDTLRSKADRSVKSGELGEKGQALPERRANTRIPPEVKGFLSELFVSGEENSSAKVSILT